MSKVQKTSSILRLGFALSKWPHLHRAYVVGGCLFNFGTVSGFDLAFMTNEAQRLALTTKEYQYNIHCANSFYAQLDICLFVF